MTTIEIPYNGNLGGRNTEMSQFLHCLGRKYMGKGHVDAFAKNSPMPTGWGLQSVSQTQCLASGHRHVIRTYQKLKHIFVDQFAR